MFSNIKEEILKGSFSAKKSDSKYEKSNFKRIVIKEEIVYQFSFFTKTQVFHENIKSSDLFQKCEQILKEYFNQASLCSKEFTYDYKVTSKGKLLNNKYKNKEVIKEDLSHNKEKNYLLKEGTVVLPLVDLGVMLPDGSVVKKYYDKYKQINKYLEIIDDTIKDEKKINIIDFGCGKSYLTFILYYYLNFVKKIEAKIIGLDLKKDVIEKCNSIRDKYKYENLSFELGDISLYQPKEKIDMIITLHACDTATDYALYHAIKLETKYIFSVPCCQHEVNSQLTKSSLELMNKYGLVKERFSALLTDSIRGNILEYCGYNVNIMEFIDIEHSPKNILIKGVLANDKNDDNIKQNILKLCNEYKIKQTLVNLIFEK